MTRKFAPEDFIGKPARIGWASVLPLLGKDDGKGNAPVKFQLQFGLQDKDDKYITAKGKIRYGITVYRSAYYSNDPRLIAVGGPAYNEVMEDRKSVICDQSIDIASFREGYGNYQGQPIIDIITAPIKRKIDVVEWRYTYVINFWSSLWQLTPIIYGHTSTYLRFDFRYNEKEIREIRSLIEFATRFINTEATSASRDKAKAARDLIANLSTYSDERLRGMSNTERQQLLESLREFHNKKESSIPKAG